MIFFLFFFNFQINWRFYFKKDNFTSNFSTITKIECSYRCKTCDVTADTCLKCTEKDANRSSNTPECECKDGYYENQTLCLGINIFFSEKL